MVDFGVRPYNWKELPSREPDNIPVTSGDEATGLLLAYHAGRVHLTGAETNREKWSRFARVLRSEGLDLVAARTIPIPIDRKRQRRNGK